MVISDASSKKIPIKEALSRSNKIPLKSIKSPDGDIIDCIHIYRQPAFDHPLLKNHTILRAFAYVQSGKYLGAKAKINVWKPQVQNHEFSSSQIAILGGPNSNLSAIEAGWMVFPDLFGDDNPRLFTCWTKDGYQSTGCYNLLCLGFVQISKKLSLRATIFPISTYHGPQFDITLYIWKDPKKDAWWLQYGNNTILGYWPASVFTHLADSASVIRWGGEVVNNVIIGQHTAAEMGCGHFPEEKFERSSHFMNLLTIDESNNLVIPEDIITRVDNANCYDVEYGPSAHLGDTPSLFFITDV
nr:uncharacterized protein LOC113690579 [Coffea arabica]